MSYCAPKIYRTGAFANALDGDQGSFLAMLSYIYFTPLSSIKKLWPVSESVYICTNSLWCNQSVKQPSHLQPLNPILHGLCQSLHVRLDPAGTDRPVGWATWIHLRMTKNVLFFGTHPFGPCPKKGQFWSPEFFKPRPLFLDSSF